MESVYFSLSKKNLSNLNLVSSSTHHINNSINVCTFFNYLWKLSNLNNTNNLYRIYILIMPIINQGWEYRYSNIDILKYWNCFQWFFEYRNTEIQAKPISVLYRNSEIQAKPISILYRNTEIQAKPISVLYRNTEIQAKPISVFPKLATL